MSAQNTVAHIGLIHLPQDIPQNYVYKFEHGPRLNTGVALSIRKELA
jgi:hypothetical protein